MATENLFPSMIKILSMIYFVVIILIIYGIIKKIKTINKGPDKNKEKKRKNRIMKNFTKFFIVTPILMLIFFLGSFLTKNFIWGLLAVVATILLFWDDLINIMKGSDIEKRAAKYKEEKNRSPTNEAPEAKKASRFIIGTIDKYGWVPLVIVVFVISASFTRSIINAGIITAIFLAIYILIFIGRFKKIKKEYGKYSP